jgi:sulfur-oxidizing protein SoxA
MQHRLYDCYRQQRFPEVEYASDTITALTMFLAKNAQGGVYDAPALKR